MCSTCAVEPLYAPQSRHLASRFSPRSSSESATTPLSKHCRQNRSNTMSSPSPRRSQRSSQPPTPRRTALRNSQQQGTSRSPGNGRNNRDNAPNGTPGPPGQTNSSGPIGTSSPIQFQNSPEQQLMSEAEMASRSEIRSPLRQATSVADDERGDRTPRAGISGVRGRTISRRSRLFIAETSVITRLVAYSICLEL